MGNNECMMNGLLVLSRPIKINDNAIYGIVYDAERNNESGNNLSAYVAYLVGAEYFLKNDGKISDDGRLMKGIVNYLTFEYNEPIVWKEGEVDDDGNAARLIKTPELINRYIIKGNE